VKFPILFLATVPILLAAGPVPASGPAGASDPRCVAVYDFEAGPGTNPDMGIAVSAMIRADISLLPPLAAMDRDRMTRLSAAGAPGFSETVSREAAADMGRRTGSAALVTGRIIRGGPDFILAAKVIACDQGIAFGAMVHGEHSAALADLVSDLSIKIASIVTGQGDSQAAKAWPPAAIHGTLKKGGWLIFSRSEMAGVSEIDGRLISAAAGVPGGGFALRPGRHQIQVIYSDGESIAEASFSCDARPGARYQVRSEGEPEDKVKLWIEDRATGRPATRVATVATRRAVPPKVIIDTRMLPGG